MPATVLITRPKPQAEAFATALAVAHGGPVPCVISPLTAIVPLTIGGAFVDVKHVLFTSVNGVAQALRIGIPTTAIAWCVGAKTAQAASQIGFGVRVADGDSRSLVARIVADKPVGQIIHVRGRHVAGDVIGGLSAAGIACDAVVAYDQIAVAPTQAAIDVLRGETPVIVPLFSPRSAKMFGKIDEMQAPLHIVSLSAAIDHVLLDSTVVTRTVARSGDAKGMVDATLARYRQFSP